MHSIRSSKIIIIVCLVLCILLVTLAGCLETTNLTIRFESNGGSKVAPRTISADTKELKLPTPDKDGYIFDGWFYDAEFSTIVDPSTIPTQSVTFYAKWSVIKVTISFLDSNDDLITKKEVDYSSDLAYSDLPSPPIKEGFVGEWHSLDKGKVTSEMLKDIKEDFSLKVFYIQNLGSVSYYVNNNDKDAGYTYLTDKGEALAGYSLYSYDQGLPAQTTTIPEKNPYKQGHTFLGWFYDKNLTDKCVTLPDNIPSYNLILYAGFIDATDMYKYLTYENTSIGVKTGLIITGLTTLGRTQSTIAIPSQIEDKDVIAIGSDYTGGSAQSYRVFASTYLTNVLIPDTVISIGSFAFAQNTRLKTVTVNASTENTYNLISIGLGAFAGCTSLTEINIPDSVATIGSFAFAGITRTANTLDDQTITLSQGAGDWAELDDWYLTDMALEKINISENSVLTNLYSYAFYNTPNLNTINLPKSLTHINYDMFDGSFLQSIVLYDGNTDLINIGDAIYSKDKTTLFYYPIYGAAEFALDDNTTEIAPHAFYNNKSLTQISFNNNLKQIGAHSFENAISLVSVLMGEQSFLNNIGAYAFAKCQSLTEIVFPVLLNTLGEGAFKDCTGISNIVFSGNSLNAIPSYAFYQCKNLVEVTIQPNVKSVGSYAFYGCTNLEYLDIENLEQSLMDTIADYAFADCINLDKITLPPNLQYMGDYAFAGIAGTMKVRMSLAETNLEFMGAYALANNTGLDTISLPQTLLTLSEGVFANCTGLYTLQINTAPNLTAIPNKLFYNCISISNVIVFADNTTHIGDYAFYNCKLLGTITFNNVDSIGKSAFENCSNLREGSNANQHILPHRLHTLGERAFANCTSLTSIHIPKDLKVLSKEAFSHCSSLDSVIYNTDYTLHTIGENSFAYCIALTTFDIPATLTPRGENQGFIKNPFFGSSSLSAFTSHNTNLNNLVVKDGIVFEKTSSFEDVQQYAIYAYPTGRGVAYEVANDITSINPYAFYGSRIVSLTFAQSAPQGTREPITLVDIGDYAFASCDMLTTALLSKRVYKVGDYAFANSRQLSTLNIDAVYAVDGGATQTSGVFYEVTNPGHALNDNNLLTIGDYAFSKVAITALTVSPRIININKGAFSDCYDLLSIDFIDSFDVNLLTIGDYAFYANNGLTSLTLPIQLKSIGEYAFAYCVNIADINFKTSIDANGGEQVMLDIGAYAFSNCHFLYSLSLPASLNSMGEGIFSYASRLKHINFASQLNLSRTSLALPKYAFLGDASIEQIIVPHYITSIGDSAFFALSIDRVAFLSDADEQPLSLGDYAFANLANLKSIDLPDRLTSIGNSTFENSALTHFMYNELGADLTVGNYAFRNTKISEIFITSRIKEIGVGGFSDNKYLTAVHYTGHENLAIADLTYSNSSLRQITFDNVPNKATIGKQAFENTLHLTIVSLSGNGATLEAVTEIDIGEKAFYKSGITNIIIASPVVKIGDSAFEATKLKSLRITADTIKDIGKLAIADNPSLENLDIRANLELKNLGDGFASYNTLLAAINLVDQSTVYNTTNGVVYHGTSLIAYPAGKVGSTYRAINGEYILTKTNPKDMADNFGIYYTYEDGKYTQLAATATWQPNTYYTRAVKSIAPYAFAGNTHLRNLIMDSGIVVLQKDSTSFAETSGSLTFFVPSSLVNRYINDWAINNVTYITTNLDGMVLKLLDSNRYTLEKYTGTATEIVIESKKDEDINIFYNVVSIADNAFNQNISIEKITLGKSIEKVGKSAFANCTALTEFTTVSGSILTVISTNAFQNCTNLSSVDLSQSAKLRTIDGFAFENCSSLLGIELPDSVRTIGQSAFANCVSLVDVNLGNGLQTIMGNCFENCSSLVSIAIPESVTSISSYVFANCNLLSYVYLNGTSIPTLEKNGFALTLDGLRIIVPERLLFSFKSAANWRNYATQMLSKENICQEAGFENYILERISGNNYRLVGYIGSQEDITIVSDIAPNIVLTQIGSYAINHFAKNITLGEGITVLSDYAFYNAKSLQNIVLPSSLITINNYAFAQLDKLNSVEISDFVDGKIVVPKLETIGAYAFYNAAIEHFVVPEKVTSIGKYAFSVDHADRARLTTIKFNMKTPQGSLPLGNAKLKIGEYAFKNNIQLKSIAFDCYVDTIGQGAFDNCTSLRNIYFHSTRLDAQGKSTETLNGVTIFANCTNLTVFVPSTSILHNFKNNWQNDADKNKLYLSSDVVRDSANNVVYVYEEGAKIPVDAYNYFVVEIPSSSSVAYIKNYIGDYSGRYIDEIEHNQMDTDIIIPNMVVIGGNDYIITQISAYAFNNTITSVHIPDSVTHISSFAFYNATSLKSVTFSSASKLQSIGVSAFENCTALTSFHIPSSVQNIEESAFKNCAVLASVTFAEKTSPNDQTGLKFGNTVFENCTSLTTISLPNHATSMSARVFKNATSLVSVNFDITQSKMASIGEYAFQNTQISTITLPRALQNVGDYAFDSCTSLTSVYLTNSTSYTRAKEHIFNNIPNPFIRVYVPHENPQVYNAYQAAEGWKTRSVLADQKDDDNKFNYIVTGTDTVTITNYLGTDTTMFVDSQLKINGVFHRIAAISPYAGNIKITKVEFSQTSYVSTISHHAFANCTALREVTFPHSVSNIGEHAFYGCTSLTDVSLPAGLSIISNHTFSGCSALKEITLPSSIRSLGEAAFAMCTSLNRVIVEMDSTNVLPLGASAFAGVSSNFVIIVPTTLKGTFLNEWHEHQNRIYARDEMYGDYVIKESANAIAIVQYNGHTDQLNFDEITIKGKKITEIYENAYVNINLKYMLNGKWMRNGKEI